MSNTRVGVRLIYQQLMLTVKNLTHFSGGSMSTLKHDSVIVNEHKGEEVKKSMQEFFDKIGYECKIN